MAEGGKADHSCELASPRCVTNLRVAELNLKFGADAAQKKKKKKTRKTNPKPGLRLSARLRSLIDHLGESGGKIWNQRMVPLT